MVARYTPRRKLPLESVDIERLGLQGRVELLQYVVVLWRNVPVLQGEQRVVRAQIDPNPLRSSRGLSVPEQPCLTICELRLRPRGNDQSEKRGIGIGEGRRGGATLMQDV